MIESDLNDGCEQQKKQVNGEQWTIISAERQMERTTAEQHLCRTGNKKSTNDGLDIPYDEQMDANARSGPGC